MAVAADALVVTAREELDGFLEEVSRKRPDERVDAVLSHANPDLVELRLQNAGKLQRFGEGDAGELAESVRQALGVFDTSKQELLQESVRIDGDRASVTTRIGDDSYEQTVIYELTRKDGPWIIRSLRVL